MKIAFCLFRYFPFGGLQRDFMRIAAMCRAQNYEIVVYTMEWQGAQPQDFEINILPKKHFSNHSNVLNFAKLIKEKTAQNPVEVLIGFDKIPGLDIYYCADSCYVAKVNEQKAKYLKWLYKLTKRYRTFSHLEDTVFNQAHSTRVLFLSAQEQKKYQQTYDISSERCSLLPPNINKTRFQPVADQSVKSQIKRNLADKHDIDYSSHWLLMVGSGFKTKGVDRSIRLLKFLASNKVNAKLLVIGQDNPNKFLQLAKKLNVSADVKFLGPQENVQEFMSVATLFVHPAYRENTGTVILESIIMGLPVVASGICGYAPYVVEAKGGKIIPEPFQQADFNHAVLDLLSNNKKLRLCAESGLKFRETANIYNADDDILRIIQNV